MTMLSAMRRFTCLSILLAAAAFLTACGTGSRLGDARPMKNVRLYVGPTGAAGPTGWKGPPVGPTGATGPTGCYGPRTWVAVNRGPWRFLACGDAPSASPDGRYVAYVDEGTEYVIPAAGGKPTTIGYGHWGPTWAPNSRLLAYLGDSPNLVVVDVQTGKQQVSTPAAYDTALAFSPDSQRIAYTRGGARQLCCHRDLFVVPTSGGAPVRITDDHRVYGYFSLAWGAPGIAFPQTAHAGTEIWLTDGRKHDGRRLTHGGDIPWAAQLYFSANGRELRAARGARVWAIDLSSGDVRKLR